TGRPKCIAKETCAKLQVKLTDLESRSRHNNIRIIDLSEETEGLRPTAFFAELLSEVFPSPPEIDRAHRALSAKPRTGGKPRAVIIRLHHFQNKERIIREACARRGKHQFRGKLIFIFEDFAPDVLEQRTVLVDVLQVRKFVAYDGLHCPHHSLQGLAVIGSIAAVPDSDAGREDALYGASVEVGEDVRRQTKLPEPSKEEEWWG
ncbi:hypothetical protein NFI96_016490, partial [Prochilodus magdalenae]